MVDDCSSRYHFTCEREQSDESVLDKIIRTARSPERQFNCKSRGSRNEFTMRPTTILKHYEWCGFRIRNGQ